MKVAGAVGCSIVLCLCTIANGFVVPKQNKDEPSFLNLEFDVEDLIPSFLQKILAANGEEDFLSAKVEGKIQPNNFELKFESGESHRTSSTTGSPIRNGNFAPFPPIFPPIFFTLPPPPSTQTVISPETTVQTTLPTSEPIPEWPSRITTEPRSGGFLIGNVPLATEFPIMGKREELMDELKRLLEKV